MPKSLDNLSVQKNNQNCQAIIVPDLSSEFNSTVPVAFFVANGGSPLMSYLWKKLKNIYIHYLFITLSGGVTINGIQGNTAVENSTIYLTLFSTTVDTSISNIGQLIMAITSNAWYPATGGVVLSSDNTHTVDIKGIVTSFQKTTGSSINIRYMPTDFTSPVNIQYITPISHTTTATITDTIQIINLI